MRCSDPQRDFVLLFFSTTLLFTLRRERGHREQVSYLRRLRHREGECWAPGCTAEPWQAPEPALLNAHKLDGFKQQFTSSIFWRPEARDPGVGGALLPLEVLGVDGSLPSPASSTSRRPLACGRITPVSASVLMWPSLLIKIPVIGLRAQNLRSCLRILIFIISA